MKKLLLLVPLLFAISGGGAMAREVHDWDDLHRVHINLQKSLRAMERAQAANHYDMGGHAAKAEQLIREAEHELREAVEARKQDRR